MMEKSKLGDRVVAGILLALAVGMFSYTLTFPGTLQPTDPGTAALPRILAVALGALAVALLLRPNEVALLPERDGALPVVGIVVLTAIYAAVLPILGFLISTILYLVGALLLMKIRRPVYLVLVPIAVSITLFGLFGLLLEVPLPYGFVERILT
ncbi:MAG: tripartite tricarboxylate transporter TctB family protein [Actinomycetota bacterium]|nr:tripartite tricarboxylate transporter TctB family protein [Rubrobacter sp.]MDQ3507146.1 tripartite tricarboxylate transporter TctB family protein [Actinomycetota bacterium]